MNKSPVIEDLNISKTEQLITPELLKQNIPVTDKAINTVSSGRQAIKNILDRTDPRLFVVIGPCSIHDTEAALDYAQRLKALAEEVSDTLYLVMRVYFEKPRTAVGWKGLINDPHMNSTFDVEHGLHVARDLLTTIAEMGVPASTEALDPISPQFLQDLVTWSAIGARTTESQTHREMASGLSSVIGFKNGTDGGLDVALNALQSVASPHRFLGINHAGEVAVIHTRGNRHSHIILRGGAGKTNYNAESVAACEKALMQHNHSVNIMIDCSHANSEKDHNRQQQVMEDVAEQIANGNQSIIGLMVESNINEGNQKIGENPNDLQYGVSVTDACVDWETTETMIRELRDTVKEVMPKRGKAEMSKVA